MSNFMNAPQLTSRTEKGYFLTIITIYINCITIVYHATPPLSFEYRYTYKLEVNVGYF